MRVLVLSAPEVEELLPMRECIGLMEDALAALARGEAHNPLRQGMRGPGAPGILGLMPAWRGGSVPWYAVKEICVFPGNPRRGLDTHLGTVVLHSGETGEPVAFINAAAVTAIRTAAVSALATRLLSRPESSVLAVLGGGVQARSHLEAIPLVRDIRETRTWSRSGGSASSAEEAVRGADIIVTATSSSEPVLRRAWISPGAHINAVGSCTPTARELDGETMAAASLFVDRRESTVNESGDYLLAVREQAIGGPAAIRGEIGELLIGTSAGRSSSTEVTLFKSLGLAVEDLAAAVYLYERAREGERGTWVDF